MITNENFITEIVKSDVKKLYVSLELSAQKKCIALHQVQLVYLFSLLLLCVYLFIYYNDFKFIHMSDTITSLQCYLFLISEVNRLLRVFYERKGQTVKGHRGHHKDN